MCLRDCFGWRGAGLRLLASGERIRQPSAEVGAGRSAPAAAAAVTPRDVTAAGEGPRRRPNVAHVRGSGQGLGSQVARCVGHCEVRFKSLRIWLPLLMNTAGDAGPPDPRRTRRGERDRVRDRGGTGPPTSEPRRLTTPGAGAQDFSGLAAWGRGGRGGEAWRLTPPSSRPAAGLRGGAVSKVSPSPAGAAAESPRERRVSRGRGRRNKVPGASPSPLPGCPFSRPTPREGNGFQTPARGHPWAARFGEGHRVPEDRPELWPPASLQRPLLAGEHQGQHG